MSIMKKLGSKKIFGITVASATEGEKVAGLPAPN